MFPFSFTFQAQDALRSSSLRVKSSMNGTSVTPKKSLPPINNQVRPLHRLCLDRVQILLQHAVLELQNLLCRQEDNATACADGFQAHQVPPTPDRPPRSRSIVVDHIQQKPPTCGKIMDLAVMASSRMASTTKKTSRPLLLELRLAKVWQVDSTSQHSEICCSMKIAMEKAS